MLRLAVAALLLVAPVALAQADASIMLVARDDGGQGGWFEQDGVRAPTLALAPGSRIEVTFHNEGSVTHNLHFGTPLSAYTRLIEPGAQVSLVVEVPANATGAGAYWCDPHRQLGMEGAVRFEAPAPSATPPPPPPPSDSEAPVPALGGLIVVAVVSAVALRSRHR